jgi:DNA primase large subunit
LIQIQDRNIFMNKEIQIEERFTQKLIELKYIYREDIRDRDALERNFRKKFDALNKVNLTDSEFARLLENIITPDVFASSKILREMFLTMSDFARRAYTSIENPTMADFARRAYISIEDPTMADFARRAFISIENKITNNQKISVGDS